MTHPVPRSRLGSSLAALAASLLAAGSTVPAHAGTLFGAAEVAPERFVVVAAPERDALREAAYFVERLDAEQMPLAGLVLNRVQATGAPTLSAEQALAGAERLEEEDEDALTADLLRLHAQRMSTLARQRHLAERFTGAHPGVAVVDVPAFAGDVHDLDGLRAVGTFLGRGT